MAVNRRKFPIGFWNYMSMDAFRESDLKDWQDAAFSLIMSPSYDVGNAEHRSKLTLILDWCRQKQVEVILQDPRTSIWGIRKSGMTNEKAKLPDNYESGVRQAVAEFADRPEVVAFSVIDEPTSDIFDATVEAVRIIGKHGGTRFGFVNLLPYWEDAKAMIGHDDYLAYLEEYTHRSGTPLLCYDHYKQMTERGVEGGGYYTNLNFYRQAAFRQSVGFWNTILTTPHFRYRKPSYDDMRWQVNTSLAYGAKGILMFTLYTPVNEGQYETNYRQGPINWWGERTGTFQAIRDVNREVHDRWGGLFLELDLIRVGHFPEVPIDRVECFLGDGVLKDIRLGLGLAPHILISEFVHRTTAESYIFIVNANPRDSVQLTAGFRSLSELRRYSALGEEISVTSDRRDTFECKFWLAPGQGELYRIVKGE